MVLAVLLLATCPSGTDGCLDGVTVLFDTGTHASILLSNMEALADSLEKMGTRSVGPHPLHRGRRPQDTERPVRRPLPGGRAGPEFRAGRMR